MTFRQLASTSLVEADIAGWPVPVGPGLEASPILQLASVMMMARARAKRPAGGALRTLPRPEQVVPEIPPPPLMSKAARCPPTCTSGRSAAKVLCGPRSTLRPRASSRSAHQSSPRRASESQRQGAHGGASAMARTLPLLLILAWRRPATKRASKAHLPQPATRILVVAPAALALAAPPRLAAASPRRLGEGSTPPRPPGPVASAARAAAMLTLNLRMLLLAAAAKWTRARPMAERRNRPPARPSPPATFVERVGGVHQQLLKARNTTVQLSARGSTEVMIIPRVR